MATTWAVLLPSRGPLTFGAAVGDFFDRVAFLVAGASVGATSAVCGATNGRSRDVGLHFGRRFRLARQRLAQTLNGFPDSADRCLAIGELLDRAHSGQAVVNLNQPGCGPVGGE